MAKRGRPKKNNKVQKPTRDLDELKKFLRWCFDGNFYGREETYLSETQLAGRVCDKAREVVNKLNYEWEIKLDV